MRSSTLRTRALRLSVAALAGGALSILAGCGTDLDPDMHPGSAAVVGDERISIDAVDDMADGLCDWQIAAVPDEQRQPLPMAFLRSVSVDGLINEEKLEQYAAAHGLEPERLSAGFAQNAGLQSRSLRDYLQLLEDEIRSADGVDDDAADAALRFLQGAARYDATALAAGRAEDPSADGATAVEKGRELIEAWADEQGIEIDPRFGQASGNALEYTPPSGTLSVAVSDAAKREDFFDPEYVKSLPASQRCG